MAVKTKIEVGQVWSADGSDRQYTISRIEEQSDGTSYAYCIRSSDGSEAGWGHLDKNGYPRGWNEESWNMWTVELPTVAKTVARPSLFDFFKAVPEGNCSCNIRKEDCEYHR